MKTEQPYIPPRIEMTPVTSSNLAAVGYDAAKKTLRVQFKPSKKNPDDLGSVYDYLDVPPEVYNAVFTYESVGKWFHANVRDKFEDKKLGV